MPVEPVAEVTNELDIRIAYSEVGGSGHVEKRRKNVWNHRFVETIHTRTAYWFKCAFHYADVVAVRFAISWRRFRGSKACRRQVRFIST